MADCIEIGQWEETYNNEIKLAQLILAVQSFKFFIIN